MIGQRNDIPIPILMRKVTMIDGTLGALASGAVWVGIIADGRVAVALQPDQLVDVLRAPEMLPGRLIGAVARFDDAPLIVVIEVDRRLATVVGIDLDAAVRDDLAISPIRAVVGIRRERRLRRAGGVAALDRDQAIPGVVDELENAIVGEVTVVVVGQGRRVRGKVVVDHDRVAAVVEVQVGVVIVADLHVVEVLRRRAGDVAVEQAGLARGPVVVDRGRVEQGGLVAPGAIVVGVDPEPQPLQGGVSEIVTHDHFASIPIPIRQ
ncbi:MAG: hypothetical protein CHACPFDD_04197 [Phycisphaerae bacterium]|nr:hypothetical protein [Phycisphaerae bacterium]